MFNGTLVIILLVLMRRIAHGFLQQRFHATKANVAQQRPTGAGYKRTSSHFVRSFGGVLLDDALPLAASRQSF